MSQPTILYHWREICLRAFYVVLSFFVTFTMCFYYSSQLLYLFVRPLLQLHREFIFTDITEAFFTTFSVSFQITTILSFFVVAYQVCCYFIPSCYAHERKDIFFFLICICVMIVCSLFCLYFVCMPILFHFFMDFSIKSASFSVELQARIYSYILLISKLVLFFLVFFLLLTFFYYSLKNLARKEVHQFKALCQKRSSILLLLFVFAAFISPPDPLSQTFIVCFFIFFFELMILLAFVHVEIDKVGIYKQSLPKK